MPVVLSVPSRPSIASERRAVIAGPNSCRTARRCCLRRPATTNTGWSEAHIALVRLDTGQHVDLVPRGTYPKYGGGVLFYAESNRLVAQAFDPGRPQASGAAMSRRTT